LQLGPERYLVPEVLFRQGRGGLPWLVLQTVQQAAAAAPAAEREAIWSRLLMAIVLVGGTAQLPGLRNRLKSEISASLSKLRSTDGRPRRGLEVTVLPPVEGLGNARTAVFHGGQFAALAAATSELASVACPELPPGAGEDFCEPEPMRRPCCVVPWRGPMRGLRGAVAATWRTAGSTFAAWGQRWSAASHTAT